MDNSVEILHHTLPGCGLKEVLGPKTTLKLLSTASRKLLAFLGLFFCCNALVMIWHTQKHVGVRPIFHAYSYN